MDSKGLGARIERQLVLVGGGHAHIEVLRRWAMQPLPGVRVVLVNPGPVAFYSGMLPGWLAGNYSSEEISIDLFRLCKRANIRLMATEALSLDPVEQKLFLRDQQSIPYSLISFDIGSAAHSLQKQDSPWILETRPLAAMEKKISAWDERVARMKSAPRIAVVGGGAAAVELSLALAVRYQKNQPQITLYFAGGALSKARAYALLGRGILLEPATRVREITSLPGDEFSLQSTEKNIDEKFDLVVAATGPKPAPFFADSPLSSKNGYLQVTRTLNNPSFPNVFGAGDCIDFPGGLDKAGVFAVRQAPILNHNLRAALTECPLKVYRPQKHYLRLLNLGNQRALLEWRGIARTARTFFALKDSIDKRFMQRYRAKRSLPMGVPNCEGCGAKISAKSLGDALQVDLFSTAEDVVSLKLDATEIAWTIDQFVGDAFNPYELGRLAVEHSLSDLYAKGIQPQAALAGFVVARAKDIFASADLAAMLAGAREQLGSIPLLGGQSSEGVEASAALTLLGILNKNGLAQRLIPKHGALPGDSLLLTRALGTGIYFTAAMAAALKGSDWQDLLARLLRRRDALPDILAQFPIRAATDITGFGFLGHLREMLAGETAVELDLKKIPVLPRAHELLAQGYHARLETENRRYAGALADRYPNPVFVDPQTCGGLLLAVPAAAAEPLLLALRAVEPETQIIGRIGS